MAPSAEVKDPWGNQRVGASISTKINRHDWGLNYSKMVEAGAVVGDEITISIDLKKKAEAAAKDRPQRSGGRRANLQSAGENRVSGDRLGRVNCRSRARRWMTNKIKITHLSQMRA